MKEFFNLAFVIFSILIRIHISISTEIIESFVAMSNTDDDKAFDVDFINDKLTRDELIRRLKVPSKMSFKPFVFILYDPLCQIIIVLYVVFI